jgi:hypothetical protein
MSPTFQGTAVGAYAIRSLVAGRATTTQAGPLGGIMGHARLRIITFGGMNEPGVRAVGRTFIAKAAHAQNSRSIAGCCLRLIAQCF